jgi:hypothetical protein
MDEKARKWNRRSRQTLWGSLEKGDGDGDGDREDGGKRDVADKFGCVHVAYVGV